MNELYYCLRTSQASLSPPPKVAARNLLRRRWWSTAGFSSLTVVKTITKKRLTRDAKQVLLAAGGCWGCVISQVTNHTQKATTT